MEPTSTPTITQATTTSVGLRYGVLIGLVSIVLSFLSFSLGWQENWGMRVVSIAVMVTGIVLAQREFKKQNGGFMSYGQGIGVAVIVGVVMGLLSALFVYVYMGIIAPETITAMLDKTRQGMEAKGNLTDEQIDQGIAVTSKFMTAPLMAVFTLVGSVFYALLISLISSAFVKNTKPEFE